MFLGHFGLGLGAKAVAPRTSLGALFLAAQWVDLLWPTLLLAGVERVAIVPGATRVTPLVFIDYPFTHSLAAVLLWGAGLGAAYALLRRYPRGAWVCAALVVSHWVLDAIVHRPDLPLLPGGSVVVGLGLWDFLGATLALEMGLLATGVLVYARTTRARDRAGSIGLAGLVGFLVLVYAASLLGPPPPSVAALAWVGEAQWLLVAWGYWLDGRRGPR